MDDNGIVGVEPQGATGDLPGTTVATPDTTPHTPNVDQLLSDLEKVADNIPPEKIRFLDKHFQPAFSRRMNILNDTVTEGVKSTLTEAGIQLPEGKTGLDLLTENGGKDFWNTVRQVVSKEFEPVKAKISAAEQQDSLRASISQAQKDNPEVSKYLNAAIETIDKDQDLTRLAMIGGGKGLYYVLQGVAATHAVRDRDATIAQLKGILDANKIAIKTSNGTTRSGTGAQKTDAVKPAKATTLKDALAIAASRFKEGEA